MTDKATIYARNPAKKKLRPLRGCRYTRRRCAYDLYIDPTDTDWIDSEGASYEGVTFTDGATTVVYYNQLDSRWKDLPYGKTGTIGASGCGPTSLAIAVSTLSGQTVDPVQMANWAYANGYRCEGNGSYHSLIPEGAKHFGLTVDYAGVNDAQKAADGKNNEIPAVRELLDLLDIEGCIASLPLPLSEN